jgi:crotonobetainyl-CoA:carnitine CoA-transferase CaiB-like acyl-CoA transferase
MLSSYRVLDLADERGMFCGYLLAHLGADVIAVEPPGGSPTRRDGGLLWEAYGRGKRSLVLDLEAKSGRGRFKELLADADFLIESFSNEEARRLGLDYASLSEVNPRLIWVSITPFGRAGPKADWPATDLTVWAAGGAHVLAGDDDRAPVRTSVPQSFLHAGADAAGAALIALQERHRSGRGQHVDVSAQQSSAQAALSANLAAPNDSGLTVRRIAGGLRATLPIRLTWPCRDGYVAITLLFGPAFSEANRRLLGWLHEHGACTPEEVEIDWGARIANIGQGVEPPEPYFELCRKIESFTRERSQQDLFEEGLKRGVYIAPALDVAGLLQEPHFHARGFWHEIEPGVRAPGAFAKLSRSPLVLPGVAERANSAPDVGWRARDAEPAVRAEPARDALPLSRLRVLDFMWVIAGPFCTRVLADYGATVIKVESSIRLEPARPAPPFKDGVPGIETGVPFANFNAGKLGVTLDPANPVGREVLLDLVRWADVVTESFSPKAMKAWKLDYETLREVNPRLIMLSSCLMGQTGPRAQVPGYGNMAAAITGFYDLTGWPDRSPAGPYLAYTDGVSPRFMLVALLSALEHRRKTGEGQHIDVSQAEAAIHLLAPAILDHERKGRTWHRMGNRDLVLAPHGVYPARGEDRWVAIACQSDEAWSSLCAVMGFRPEAALSTAAGRRGRQDELDRRIAEWTCTRDEADIERALIDAGVAAHVVQNSAECCTDPQLCHRNHFVSVTHPTLGTIVVEGTRFRLQRTPGRVTRGAPGLGEHNVHVLENVLGYDADRIADIFASLAME